MSLDNGTQSTNQPRHPRNDDKKHVSIIAIPQIIGVTGSRKFPLPNGEEIPDNNQTNKKILREQVINLDIIDCMGTRPDGFTNGSGVPIDS